jgi:lipid-A-disaccharide synthase
MSARRLFIVAGEASGDTHAARLITAVKAAVPELRVEGLGGDEMRKAGCELHADIVSTAVMGFVQVAKNLRYFRNLLHSSIDHMRTHRPDAIVLVDYPGLNLRLAKAAKRMDIPVIYYISPQVWAWRSRRINKIARLVDKMMVILPFEAELYENVNVDVTYVGHPILDSIAEQESDDEFLASLDVRNPKSVIGLLPGSRKQEIAKNLPVMLETARILRAEMPDVRFLIPCSSQENVEAVKKIIEKDDLPVRVFLGKIYEVAKVSRCCIVASGTATLEVACFLTPLIVVYKIGRLTWMLGRRFLHVDNISLVNILAGKEIVPEMLQSKMRPELLAREVAELCEDGAKRETMIEELKSVRERLGAPGASMKAAQIVREVLEESAETDSRTAQPQEQSLIANG